MRRTARRHAAQDIDGRKLLQKGEGAYFAVAPATRARLARVRNMVLGAFVFSLNVMPHGPVIGLQSGQLWVRVPICIMISRIVFGGSSKGASKAKEDMRASRRGPPHHLVARWLQPRWSLHPAPAAAPQTQITLRYGLSAYAHARE